MCTLSFQCTETWGHLQLQDTYHSMHTSQYIGAAPLGVMPLLSRVRIDQFVSGLFQCEFGPWTIGVGCLCIMLLYHHSVPVFAQCHHRPLTVSSDN